MRHVIQQQVSYAAVPCVNDKCLIEIESHGLSEVGICELCVPSFVT